MAGLLGLAALAPVSRPSAVPGTVTDLTTVAATDSAVTLRWTEVPSNDSTQVNWYDLRWGLAAGFLWAPRQSPLDTLRGTTRSGGAKFTTTVRGLKPATAYTFQIASCVGVFGSASCALGNTTSVTTAATPPNPPPPPPPVVVRSVRINDFASYSATLTVGATAKLSTVVRDSSGTLLSVRVTWRSSTPSLATVDTTGLVQALAVGLDTIWASAGGISSAPALFQLQAAPTVTAWGIRASSLGALALLHPACVVTWTPPATTVCGPYARTDDSTGAVLQHFTVTFTVSP